MFRLSQYMHELSSDDPPPPVRGRADGAPVRPVVIWNLTRRCNLRCRHCYTTSADVDFPGELTHEQALGVVDDLASLRLPATILSGGEPLARRDFFEIAARSGKACRYLALSTNGTRVVGEAADKVAAIGFNYVGISLDGIGRTNDWFRGKEGAFADALEGVRACKARDIRVGIRFTITKDNAAELPRMLKLCEDEGIDKFYLSHIVYAGRGDKHRGEDADRARTRETIALLVERAFEAATHGEPLEIVTGNNDADAVYFLRWAEDRFPAEKVAGLRKRLTAWGGNAAGVGVANIDPQGNVHPDIYWSDYTIGSVKEAPFSALWYGNDPMLAALRQRPRPLKGRCGACAYKAVCGGNTRIRALQLTGDPWAADPACFLSDAGIGVEAAEAAVPVAPFRGKRHDPIHRFF
ncbi:MAG: heme d1 biosynthesis radical SAM protein NirJ [Pseudomonadota bacterium]